MWSCFHRGGYTHKLYTWLHTHINTLVPHKCTHIHSLQDAHEPTQQCSSGHNHSWKCLFSLQTQYWRTVGDGEGGRIDQEEKRRKEKHTHHKEGRRGCMLRKWSNERECLVRLLTCRQLKRLWPGLHKCLLYHLAAWYYPHVTLNAICM